jgi:hypothetical protein
MAATVHTMREIASPGAAGRKVWPQSGPYKQKGPARAVRAIRAGAAADIVKYMRGWSRDRVRQYCYTKGRRVSVIEDRRADLPGSKSDQ